MSSTNLRLDGIINAALEINAKRQEILTQMREARLRGDNDQALTLMDEYLGLTNEKSN